MALEWSRSTVREETNNTEFQKTQDALVEKLKVLEYEKNINSNNTRININI